MSDHSDFTVNEHIIPKERCVIAEQTHSANVHVCTEADGGSGWDDKPQILNTDALITNVPELYLISRTADCTPILMYDEVNGAVAAIHSGREGTRKNIARNAIQSMVNTYHTEPNLLKVLIGAGICEQHYEVSIDMWKEFTDSVGQQDVYTGSMPYRRLNIQNVIYQQLILAGVKPDNIITNHICTFESEQHFSYRRNGSHNRQINIIGLCHG